MLNTIRIKCSKYKPGCREHLTYEDAISGRHEEEECRFKEISCENCGDLILRKDVVRHKVDVCKNGTVTCKLCKTQFSLDQEEQHSIECLNKIHIKTEAPRPR